MNFINLFKPKPQFFTGEIDYPEDSRDIELSEFQDYIILPDYYQSNISRKDDQKRKGTCVGAAIQKLLEIVYLSNDINEDLSMRDAYRQCKEIDGMPYAEGTAIPVALKVAYNSGLSTTKNVVDNQDLPRNEYLGYEVTEEILKDRSKFKINGYAQVNKDYGAICQAIFQNGAVICSVLVDKNWFNGIITKPLANASRHAVVLYGFDRVKGSIIGENSWGEKWVGYIEGKPNKDVPQGSFEIMWDDLAESIRFIYSITDVPLPLIKTAQAKNFMFTKDLKPGSDGPEVVKLQQRLIAEKLLTGKADGYYGNNTKNAVIKFQKLYKLPQVGNVGPATRAVLNKSFVKKVGQFSLLPLVDRKQNELVELCAKNGLKIKIIEGHRSISRQNELYNRPFDGVDNDKDGRVDEGDEKVTNAKGGESTHQYGIAFDFCFDGSKPYPQDYKLWEKVGKLGESIGLEWGGRFKSFPDTPHFEMKLGHKVSDFQSGNVDYNKYL